MGITQHALQQLPNLQESSVFLHLHFLRLLCTLRLFWLFFIKGSLWKVDLGKG